MLLPRRGLFPKDIGDAVGADISPSLPLERGVIEIQGVGVLTHDANHVVPYALGYPNLNFEDNVHLGPGKCGQVCENFISDSSCITTNASRWSLWL